MGNHMRLNGKLVDLTTGEVFDRPQPRVHQLSSGYQQRLRKKRTVRVNWSEAGYWAVLTVALVVLGVTV